MSKKQCQVLFADEGEVAAMTERKNAVARQIIADNGWGDAADIIAGRKKVIRDKYRQRYVSEAQASEWMASPLHALHVAARRAMEAVGMRSSASDRDEVYV